tara:strand:+ start:27270 stop:27440 length:171 start_codon:yes stop_codon:yes gene_type:complete
VQWRSTGGLPLGALGDEFLGTSSDLLCERLHIFFRGRDLCEYIENSHNYGLLGGVE